MAKAVGLDAGEYEVKLVELDGSYRKTRLSKIIVERVEQDDAGADDALHASRGAMAALRAFKEANANRDNITLGFPAREAVFRRLTVPFTGREQIRKVIKFEVEGSIHSHNVDDMVVDFHTVAEEGGKTQVMVAAVPKTGLEMTLLALERSGIEPEVVDLDAMALYRVADWCGAFSAETTEAAADPENEEAAVVPVAADGEHSDDPVRVVLDIGARSAKVLLVVNGQLVDLRTLRSGDNSLVEDLSRSGGVSVSKARQALGYSVLVEDEPGHDELGQEAPSQEDPDDELIIPEDEEGADPEALMLAAASSEVDLPKPELENLVGLTRDRFLDRLRRELIRFLTSVKSTGPIEQVWVTGGGSSLPGLDVMLESVFGRVPERLRVFDHLSHNLDAEEVAALEPRVAVAVGLALGTLGGPAGFNFRQEELAFTRGFDRVKFPLAITCMVALFLVVVYGVKSWRDLQWLELKYGQTYTGEQETRTGRRVLQFQGYLAYVLNSPASWFAQLRNFETREYRDLLTAVDNRPVFERLPLVQSRLGSYLTREREESGVYSDLSLESGFAVVVRWAEVLKRVEARLGRDLITDLELSLPATTSNRFLRFTIALRGDDGTDFRSKHSELVRVFEEECQRAETPFDQLTDQGQEVLFSDTGGGSYYTLRVSIRPEFDSFVPPVGGE